MTISVTDNMTETAKDVLELSSPGDRYADYCLWDYEPIAPTAGKLRSASLLWHALQVSGADPRMAEACHLLRRALGPFRTIWGIKYASGRFAWEFYFYDYQRLERTVSISRVLSALSPIVRCELTAPEERPYFMFSIDLDDAIAVGRRPLSEIDIYVGNPSSFVSSGICYGLTARGLELRNFYFFFDAVRDREAIIGKIACSAHLDLPRLDLEDVLWPELVNCKTIVVANKKRNEGVYFSRIRVDQLLFMLERMNYPREIVDFIRTHQGRLDHLLFDVGLDYVMRDGRIAVVKSAYYGIL